MTVNISLTRVEQATVRVPFEVHERVASLHKACTKRSEVRLDRDKLEPAARRVDDLMNLFAGDMPHSAQGPVWIAEIQSWVEQVTNPKVAAALRDARADITALLDVMGPEGRGAAVVAATRLGG
jgi:hypothetical protein